VEAAAGAESAVQLLVTIGSDRPPGATGYDELVSQGRSALKITSLAAGELAIVGYASGTTGLPKGAAYADYVRRTSGFIPWPPR